MNDQSLVWLAATKLAAKENRTVNDEFADIAQKIKVNPPRVANIGRFENSLDAFSKLGNPHYEL